MTDKEALDLTLELISKYEMLSSHMLDFMETFYCDDCKPEKKDGINWEGI